MVQNQERETWSCNTGETANDEWYDNRYETTVHRWRRGIEGRTLFREGAFGGLDATIDSIIRIPELRAGS